MGQHFYKSMNFHTLRIAFICGISFIWLQALPLKSAAATPDVVRIYYTANDAVRYSYYIELLNAALKRTEADFGPFKMEHFSMPMSSSRWNAEAIRGEKVNVMWSNVGHPDLNEKMIPIPILADRGVHGYRVLLIRADRQAEFDNVRNLDDLRQFSVGQGANWGNIKILEHNRLTVVTSSIYDNLFPMLMAGRFDYFSRSVLEAPVEMKAFESKFPGMAVERNLVLHYRFPVVFFVTKSEPQLAQRIKTGLKMMEKDGSLNELFERHFRRSLAQLNLGSRRIIELENPFLPAYVPKANHSTWFTPFESK